MAVQSSISSKPQHCQRQATRAAQSSSQQPQWAAIRSCHAQLGHSSIRVSSPNSSSSSGRERRKQGKAKMTLAIRNLKFENELLRGTITAMQALYLEEQSKPSPLAHAPTPPVAAEFFDLYGDGDKDIAGSSVVLHVKDAGVQADPSTTTAFQVADHAAQTDISVLHWCLDVFVHSEDLPSKPQLAQHLDVEEMSSQLPLWDDHLDFFSQVRAMNGLPGHGDAAAGAAIGDIEAVRDARMVSPRPFISDAHEVPVSTVPPSPASLAAATGSTIASAREDSYDLTRDSKVASTSEQPDLGCGVCQALHPDAKHGLVADNTNLGKQLVDFSFQSLAHSVGPLATALSTTSPLPIPYAAGDVSQNDGSPVGYFGNDQYSQDIANTASQPSVVDTSVCKQSVPLAIGESPLLTDARDLKSVEGSSSVSKDTAAADVAIGESPLLTDAHDDPKSVEVSSTAAEELQMQQRMAFEDESSKPSNSQDLATPNSATYPRWHGSAAPTQQDLQELRSQQQLWISQNPEAWRALHNQAPPHGKPRKARKGKNR